MTSVDVDQQVLHDAKVVFGVRTNREVIDLALREAVLRRRQLDAIDEFAAIPVDVDPRPISHGED